MALGKGFRVFLIVMGALALVTALLVGGFVWWVNSSNIRAAGEEIKAEAVEFARGREDDDCVGEGLRRLRACDGFMCTVKANVFLGACLDAADRTPDMCQGVPLTSSIMDSVAWRIQQCAAVGEDGDACPRLFGEIQKYCDDG